MSDTTQHRCTDPTRNLARFYQLTIHPDLLGGSSLVREWGRIGSPGRVRIEPFDELAAAEAAGERLERIKRGRGYQ